MASSPKPPTADVNAVPPRPIFDADDDDHIPSDQVSPLLGDSVSRRYDGVAPASRRNTKPSATELFSNKSRSTTPSFISIVTLALFSILILIGVFILPHNVEAYVKQAVVLEPTNLAIESVTADGIRARIEGTFKLDSGRVSQDTARKVGSFATSLVRTLGTEETRLDLYHAGTKDGHQHLGSLTVPPLTVNLVDGHVTKLHFVTDIIPGDAEVFRNLANQWLDGQLGNIKVLAKSNITVKSGIIPLGTHSVAEAINIQAGDIPTIPQYTISSLEFHDVPDASGHSAVGADVAVTAYNKHPIQINIPSLAFDVLIPGCNPLDSYLHVARATTDEVRVTPRSNVRATGHAIVREIPKSITHLCPKSSKSPLDEFLRRYMKGEDATVFVRGSTQPNKGTPDWISTILKELTVPVPFPGHSFDSLIKEFSLTDVSFTLPDPFAEPGDPDADPKVSGSIRVLAALPKQLNIDIGVTELRAKADVLYGTLKFGELHLEKWHRANSTKVKDEKTGDMRLEINSRVEDAPLTITDANVFSDVVSRILFGGSDIELDVNAVVDVKVNTGLGELVLKDVPASGKIPVKHLPGGSLKDGLEPQISELRIVESTETSMTMSALVNVTNPTPYSAVIPYINIHIVKNGSVLGNATLRNVDVSTGHNFNVPITAIWAPGVEGLDARQTGVNLISQYLSGYNTTVDVQMHNKSVPACPILGRSLSNINITTPVPRLGTPGQGGHHPDHDKNKNEFIRDAIFHLFTSTATFTLVSPLQYDTIILKNVNATAFWNHSERVGEIRYGYPLTAPPGLSTTPRLPVDWNAGSLGYDKVLGALGGQLKLDARANVTMKIGEYEETIWYVGQGIGASVRL